MNNSDSKPDSKMSAESPRQDNPMAQLFQRRQNPEKFEKETAQPRYPSRNDQSDKLGPTKEHEASDFVARKNGILDITDAPDLQSPGSVSFEEAWGEEDSFKEDSPETDLFTDQQHTRVEEANVSRTAEESPTGVIAVAQPVSNREVTSGDMDLADKEIKKQWWKDRRTRIVLLLLLLAFVAFIVCLSVLLTQNDSNSSKALVPDNAPQRLPGNWTQVGETIAGGRMLELYGRSVALSNDGLTLIGGADDFSRDDTFVTGGAYVHRLIGENWVQLGQTLEGNGTNDSFGIDAAINGNGTIVAVGAYFGDPEGIECCNAGYVRVYRLVNDTWDQMGQILIGESKSDRFGLGLSISDDGTTIAIGARRSGRFERNAGAVRVFSFVDGNWTQVGQHLDGEAKGDGFGEYLSLSGDGTVVAIGSARSRNATGHVRIFQLAFTGNWTQLGQTIEGDEEGDAFSSSVSLSSAGSRVAIGAPNHNGALGNFTGQVRTYQLSLSSGNWTLLGQTLEGQAGSIFGRSVSLSDDGTSLAVGSPRNADTYVDAGKTQVFRLVDDLWAQVGPAINGEERDEHSGRGVALSSDGGTLAVGSPLANEGGSNSGKVRVFQLS